VPVDVLGRVSSLDEFGSAALLPLGYVLTGWCTALVGGRVLFNLAGALTIMVALIGLSFRGIRRWHWPQGVDPLPSAKRAAGIAANTGKSVVADVDDACNVDDDPDIDEAATAAAL
jgi:hypothetical protein